MLGLRVIRKRRGWRQKDLSSRVGCHVQYIQKIENGVRPSYDLAFQLAVILDVPTIEIMGVFHDMTIEQMRAKLLEWNPSWNVDKFTDKQVKIVYDKERSKIVQELMVAHS